MRISDRFAGLALPEREVTVSARHAMNFAAAVGETQDRYYDDLDTGEVPAHPVFPCALTWPLCNALAEHLAGTGFPEAVLQRQVHYTERLRFFRPLWSGQRLVLGGEIAAILPHRSGTCLRLRLTGRDGNGAPVFQEEITGLLRDVACEPCGAAPAPEPEAGTAGGKVVLDEAMPVSPLFPYWYDGCSDIHFPIHTSRRYARDAGLPGVIVHGTGTLAMAVSRLSESLSPKAGPGAHVEELACRFGAMVLPGERLRVQARGLEGARRFGVAGVNDPGARANPPGVIGFAQQ
ncbi:MAG: MaoC family dehydratase N-terminal domain-containing protein [Ectothiorhodospiraceae bacterium]|nr:MaoC family dehydratase N-terminal domain-containing protein [Ectothiorhodospiraceae bacterium]